MNLKEINIQNFKCWDSVHLDKLSKYNVIIGENNVGKSAILHAINKCLIPANFYPNSLLKRGKTKLNVEVLVDLFDKDLEFLVQQWFDSRKIKDTNIAEFLKNTNEYWENIQILFKAEEERNQKSLRSHQDLLVFQNEEKITSYNFLMHQFKKSEYYTNKNPHNYFDNLNNHTKKFIEDSAIFIPSRREIKTESVNSQYVTEIDRSYSGKNLKKKLFNMKNSRDMKFNLLYEKFQSVIEHFSFSPGKPDFVGETSKNIDLVFRKPNNEPIILEELGDGLIDLVVIVGLCIANPHKVILIEEPELHLHPRAIRELRDFFKYEASNQIIITTHNSAFIGSMDDKTNVFKIVTNQNKNNLVRIVNNEQLIDFRNQFGLKNSDYLFADLIVFVDGVSDVTAFSTWFELIYPKNIMIKFFPCHGYMQNHRHLLVVWMLRLENHYNFFIISDKDEQTKDEKKSIIIDKLKKENPELLDIHGIEKVRNSIYVLEKKCLESYYLNPKILALWLSVSEQEITETIDQIPEDNPGKKLHLLARKYKKSFKKKKNAEDIVNLFEIEDVDPEIQRLFKMLLVLNK